jgi:hypothetical protein
MTSKEFVIWLKGFVAGSNNYNLTPKGWDEVKEKLDSVVDANPITFSFGSTSTSTATTLPSEASVNYTTDAKTLLHD